MLDGAQPCQIKLELNFPRVFVSGCGSFLQFRIANIGSRALMGMRVTLSCRLLGLTNAITELGSMQPGETRLVHVDTQPEGAGSQVIRCEVEFSAGRDWTRLEGDFPHLTVYERPQSVSSVSVVIQDIQSNRDSAAKAEMGAVKGDVSINVSDLLPTVQTVNDLIQLRLPDAFFEVALAPGQRRDFTDILHIPEYFLRFHELAEAIHLRPSGAPQTNGEEPTGGWRLVGGGSSALYCGRSARDCDFPLRFLPATEENEKRASFLSRRHIRMTRKNGRLELENLSLSGGLVFVGTTLVKGGVTAPVSDGEIFSLGQPPGEFKLRCQFLAPTGVRCMRIANWSQWARAGDQNQPEEVADWGVALLQPENSGPAFWQTRWFHSRISFGSGAEAVMRLNTHGLDPVHGYFHHLAGSFWLENASSEGGGVMLDGVPLADGDIAPLCDSSSLNLGGVLFTLLRQR